MLIVACRARSVTRWVPLLAGVGLLAAGPLPPPGPSPREEPSAPEEREVTPCGPACMAVAFRLLGVPVRNHELDRLSDPTGVSNLYDLCQYARSKGIHADVATLSPRALVELDQLAVLHLRPPDAPTRGAALQHFVVFAGADPSGRWHAVDPIGTTPFTGLVDAEALVRSWTGRALILSREPLPWPLERGWWLRRWSMGALWWVVAPLACMVAVYAVLRWKVRSGAPDAQALPNGAGTGS